MHDIINNVIYMTNELTYQMATYKSLLCIYDAVLFSTYPSWNNPPSPYSP